MSEKSDWPTAPQVTAANFQQAMSRGTHTTQKCQETTRFNLSKIMNTPTTNPAPSLGDAELMTILSTVSFSLFMKRQHWYAAAIDQAITRLRELSSASAVPVTKEEQWVKLSERKPTKEELPVWIINERGYGKGPVTELWRDMMLGGDWKYLTVWQRATIPAPPAPELTPEERLADRFLLVAEGCNDYGGGYRDPKEAEIYHHGIQTVINALKAAAKNDPKDTQVNALVSAGRQSQRLHASAGQERGAT